MIREDEIVSEPLKLKAHLHPHGDVCWSGNDIEAALGEISLAGRVILGFDIVEPLPRGKVRLWGASDYDMEIALRSKSWNECIAHSYELAIKAVRDTRRLTGLEPPYGDLWYCVVTTDRVDGTQVEPMNREQWRDPSADEIRVLRRLLSVDFPGRDAYKLQLISLKVALDNESGTTLFILPDEDAPSASPSYKSALTSGAYADSDGITVTMLLVAGHGRLRFLDIMKLDPVREALVRFPPDNEIIVRVAPPPIQRDRPRRGRMASIAAFILNVRTYLSRLKP